MTNAVKSAITRGPAHGPQSIRELCKWILGKLFDDDDVVIAIAGRTGTGKSCLGLLLAQRLQELAPLDVSKQILFASDNLLHSARELPEGSVIVLDEATVAGNRRRSMSNQNIGIMDHLNTCRIFHHCVIFIGPQFADLDISIQTRCKWLLQVTERGKFNAIELEPVGGPTDRLIIPVVRFQDEFPNPATHEDSAIRKLYVDYLAAKESFSFRGLDPKAPLRKELKAQYEKIIDEVMEGKGILVHMRFGGKNSDPDFWDQLNNKKYVRKSL